MERAVRSRMGRSRLGDIPRVDRLDDPLRCRHPLLFRNGPLPQNFRADLPQGGFGRLLSATRECPRRRNRTDSDQRCRQRHCLDKTIPYRSDGRAERGNERFGDLGYQLMAQPRGRRRTVRLSEKVHPHQHRSGTRLCRTSFGRRYRFRAFGIIGPGYDTKGR